MSTSPFLKGKEDMAFYSSSSLVSGTPLFRSIGREDSTHSFAARLLSSIFSTKTNSDRFRYLTGGNAILPFCFLRQRYCGEGAQSLQSIDLYSANVPRQFSLSPDPSRWGSNLNPDIVEADDDMHNPSDLPLKSASSVISLRGVVNLGCLVVLALGIITLL